MTDKLAGDIVTFENCRVEFVPGAGVTVTLPEGHHTTGCVIVPSNVNLRGSREEAGDDL